MLLLGTAVAPSYCAVAPRRPPVVRRPRHGVARVVAAAAADGLLDRPGPAPVLPTLSEEQTRALAAGERVELQNFDEATGSGEGFAVHEVRADAEEIWQVVTAYHRYVELIKTCRSATRYECCNRESELPIVPCAVDAPCEADGVCYQFIVSRLRLNLSVRFVTDDSLRYASWVLDRPTWVLRDSTGFWHVEPLDGGRVRIWFSVAVLLNPGIPSFVTWCARRPRAARRLRADPRPTRPRARRRR